MTILRNDVTILLVEDDAIDVRAIKRAFKAQNITNPLVEARDGIEALEILRGAPDRPRITHPILVLLDLNMPRMNGLEFLAEIRKDERLRELVVFVLTTSKAEEDMVEAYRLNVAGYMAKSDPIGALVEKAALIERYINAVELLGER